MAQTVNKSNRKVPVKRDGQIVTIHRIGIPDSPNGSNIKSIFSHSGFGVNEARQVVSNLIASVKIVKKKD